MHIKAAVVTGTNQLSIETIDLAPPQPTEVLIKLQAAGVCHSDLHTFRGELSVAPPLVLGHEGAGVVEAVGNAVTKLKPGDHVLVNWLPACEQCVHCLNGHYNLCERYGSTIYAGCLLDGTSRLHTLAGVPLKHYLGAATMAEYAVIDQASAIPIPADVPFEVAAIIGCAVATGVGAVVKTAQVAVGSSAAVIGCGGVGLSMLQGCRLAGCHPIIAIDVFDQKLDFARKMGATHTINARQQDVYETLRAITGIGPDAVFDSVGATGTISQALQGARPGGTAVIVGLHAANLEVPLPIASLIYDNKRLLGCFAGSIRPKVDLPILVELYRAGRLDLDPLISQRYALEQRPQAFADMEAGAVARGVITF